MTTKRKVPTTKARAAKKKNPAKYAVWVSEYGKRGYFVSEKNSFSSGYVDDDIKNASTFSKDGAEKIAKRLKEQLDKNTGIVKAPTKRTKKRRAKPQLTGYSANPSKSVLYIQEVKNGSPVGKKFYYIQLSRDYYGSGIGFVENKKDASNVSDPESVMKRVFAEWNKHYAKGSKDYGLYYSGK